MRIDNGKPISATEDGWIDESARTVVKELVNARTVTTRYEEWPYQIYRDETFRMDGFSQSYKYMLWVLQGQE